MSRINTCDKMKDCFHVHILAQFLFPVFAQDPNYALKGQEINLVPSIFGQPDVIRWTHDGKKVVLFDGMEEFVFPPYENRLTLDWASAELRIRDAKYQDSGEYELEVDIYKQVHRSKYQLEIIDKVSKPSITCEMADAYQATLACSTASKHPRLVAFKWSSGGKKQPGPNLTISLMDEHDDRVYRCDVSNPLSNESATFTAKDCFLDKKSAALLGIVLPVIFAVAFILLVILGCVFRRILRACFENTKKGVFIRRRSTAEVSGSSQGDETTYFLGGLPTLPSNQRLRPLLPSDWIDPVDGNEEKQDAFDWSNEDTTADEGVQSDAATDALTSSSNPPNSPLTSSDPNTTTEHEDNSSQQQQVSGDASGEIVNDVDSPGIDKPASTSTEEKDPQEEEEGGGVGVGQEPLSDIAQGSLASGGEDQQDTSTSSASEGETQSKSGDDEAVTEEEQKETETHASLTDTPNHVNTSTTLIQGS
ncbi:SLAM family member 5-like isoform X2 [Festucalex cinctus]